ncbi:MAG TPA: VOC family protein, partial [Vicinamibacteria bacterium]|nr:VOC family protein [Vicinamibacteria bacterium]
MPEITKSEPGRFCWFELGTTDARAAARFYGSLFDWTTHEQPAQPGMQYTMLRLRGKDVGGMYELTPEMRAQGVPAHWMPYVATDNADENVARARNAGGTVVNGPFDVMDHGRMAVLKDPQGAMFSVWQAKSHPGVGVFGEPGAPCWVELATTDDEAARAFYQAVIGWKPDVKSAGPMPYTEWLASDGSVTAGMMKMTGERQKGVPPHWLTYFAVEDVDASAARVAKSCGTVMVPPMDIPEVGRFSVI